ncbi:MAG: integrin alpha, partial [Thermoplasmata archaeon]
MPRSSAVYRHVGQDQTDWNAWEFEGPILVALGSGEHADKIEVGISKSLLPDPNRAVFIFQAEDWNGMVDLADYRMAGAKGILRVTQESADQEIVQKQVSEPLLTLELKKVGYKQDTSGALTLSSIRGTLVGTLPPSEVQSVSLAPTDGSGGPWTGTVSGNGVTLFQAIDYPFPPGARTDFRVDVILGSSAPDGATVGFRIMAPNDVVVSAGATTLESVPTDHDLSYVGSIPTGYAIDGGFSDWTGVMNDGTNEPSTGGYKNVDIRQYNLNSTQDDAFFYLKVDGRMLEGTLTPQRGRFIPDYVPSQPDSDRDSIPDDEDQYPFDFDNDGTPDFQEGNDIDNDGEPDWPAGNDQWLETTVQGRDIRIYIGPRIPPPVVRGEDTVRIYLDSDKNAMTGYFVGNMGADYLVEIAGKNGEPLAGGSILNEHVGGPGSWQWVTVKDAEVALDLQNMETSVDIAGMGFLDDFSAYFETVGWLDRKDDAVGTRSLTRGDYDGYEARYAGRYEAYVKSSTGAEEAVSISYKGNELSWGLPSSLGLTGPSSQMILSTLRTTTLQLGGNEARFENPFSGMESTMTYAFESDKVKESIVIYEPLELDGVFSGGHLVMESAMSFSEELTPFLGASGITFSDGSDVVFTIEQPFAVDSGDDRLDCAYSWGGSLRSLSMQCPASWFAEASYPVTIDPTVVLETNALDEELGYNITTGDFNGDNAMDIAIGAPANDVNRDSNVGAVYVYYGGSSIDES